MDGFDQTSAKTFLEMGPENTMSVIAVCIDDVELILNLRIGFSLVCTG